MENNNQNKNNPFGNYNIPGDPPQKPRDITSDQWVPISSGTHRPQQSEHLTDRDLPQKPEPRPQQANNKRPPSKKQQREAERRKKQQKTAARSRGQKPLPSQPRPQNSRNTNTNGVRRRPADRTQASDRKDKSTEAFEQKRKSGYSPNEIRLQNRKKALRKKRLIIALTVGAIVLVALIATAVYCLTYGVPIQKITVEGTSIYSADEIINASGILIGDNMLTVRQKRTNEVLCTALPYLESVKVDYQTPDTLKLIVKANKERFLIVTDNGFICIDKNDKILSVKKKKVKDGQYRLEGFAAEEVKTGTIFKPSEDNADRLKIAKSIAEEIENAGLKNAQLIDLTDTENVILCIDNRVNVYLGNADKLEKKMNLIIEVYNQNFPGQSTGYIDAKFKKRLFYKLGSMTNT